MTKVWLEISKAGRITYDSMNHAGDHDACTIVSTLSNVLVAECYRCGYEPTIYNKGHVRIDIPDATYPCIEVFRAVGETIRQAAKQIPEHIEYRGA